MADFMQQYFGNPSSIHAFGRGSRRIVDEARTTAARAINAEFNEIVFTSGGTEADNLALIGTALANQDRGKHIITTQIEHHAVLKTCEFLEKEGFEVTYLPVDKNGIVSLQSLRDSLRDDTILVSIMYANNEIGTIQPIAEIGKILKDYPAYFHTDAVQAFGVLPIDVRKLVSIYYPYPPINLMDRRVSVFYILKTAFAFYRPFMEGNRRENAARERKMWRPLSVCNGRLN